jgi:hypothetical protein
LMKIGVEIWWRFAWFLKWGAVIAVPERNHPYACPRYRPA